MGPERRAALLDDLDLLVLAIAHVAAARLRPVLRAESVRPWAFGLGAGVLLAVTFLFMARDTAPFIYFQF